MRLSCAWSSSVLLAPRQSRTGAALLEVIIALALFVATAAVVTSALSSALDSLERQRLNTHATNLAASVLAELQLGIRQTGSTGVQAFEPPFEQWTWEAALSSSDTETGETSGLTRVEVIIRHKDSAIVRRLAQVISLEGTRRMPSLQSPSATPSQRPPGA
jgi:type II secretory pathway pseudopilin PulG